MGNGTQVSLLSNPSPIYLRSTGPDVSGVSQELPDGCTVDQVAIVSRHGSRYPDPGAYNEWLALEAKVIIPIT